MNIRVNIAQIKGLNNLLEFKGLNSRNLQIVDVIKKLIDDLVL